MIIFKIILVIICAIGFAAYFANSTTALVVEKGVNQKRNYWSKWILIPSAALSIIAMIMFILLMIENIGRSSLKNNNSQYELIQEPVYRQIN